MSTLEGRITRSNLARVAVAGAVPAGTGTGAVKGRECGVVSLNLAYTRIGDEGVKTLEAYLSTGESMRSLGLGFCGLRSLSPLSRVVKKRREGGRRPIVTWGLPGNCFGEAEVRGFSEAIKGDGGDGYTFDFSCCTLTGASVDVLLASISDLSVARLSVASNNLKTLPNLGDYKIEVLDVTGNPLGLKGMVCPRGMTELRASR